MKLISLNTWGGRLPQIDGFIKRSAADTDIFCFQEVHSNGSKEADLSASERANFFEELQQLLPEFSGVFAEQVPHTGLATFVRNTFAIEKNDTHSILTAEDMINYTDSTGMHYYPRIVQTIILRKPHMEILNFHGVPGRKKEDCPERNLQMTNLLEILDQFGGGRVLVGDFNLNPNTEAIRSLGKSMRNLVIESDFKSTRTHYYDKIEEMPFADYAFVTPDINVKDFQVLPDEVSDHSPISVDFESLRGTFLAACCDVRLYR